MTNCMLSTEIRANLATGVTTRSIGYHLLAIGTHVPKLTYIYAIALLHTLPPSGVTIGSPVGYNK